MLGCTPEEAKALLDKQREADSAAMSDADRKAAEADRDKAKALEDSNRAKVAERNANVMIALVSEGVQFERNDDGSLKGKGARVMQLVNADLEPGADAAAIATAVASVKADTPELFVAPSGDGGGDGGSGGDGSNGGTGGDGGTGRPPPSGDLGPDGKPRKPATTSDLERGAERAKVINDREKPFDVASLRPGASA